MLDHRLLVNPPGAGVVTVKGSNRADGELVNGVSFEVDEDGFAALRVVDAAPFAYDDVNERLLVTSEPVEQVVWFHDVSSTEVAASDQLEVILDPGAGYIGRVTRFGYRAPAPSGAASGTHTLRVLQGSGVTGGFANERLVDLTAAFGSPVNLAVGTKSATAYYLEGHEFSSDEPLRFRYFNGTDVAQTGERRLLVYYTKRKVQSA